ncbi:MAG TPA: GNAT family N-acetyltransferase [Burkholderiaceae bacterium]|nr:GNAT family N-acetyltransferase [Burkholderiaceae bacterium]
MHEFYAESGYSLDRQWAASSFLELLTQPSIGCTWLAYREAEPVGHAVLILRYTMEHGGMGGYVDDLFVRARFRRHGAARAMLGELFAECGARGCRSVQVEAGRDNTAALRLYAEFGLVPHEDGRVLLAVPLGDARA